MTLPIIFLPNGVLDLFQWQKHFVSMLETLCFNGRNTLFLWSEQIENTIP